MKTMADQIFSLIVPDIQVELVLVVDNIEIPKSTIHRCFGRFPYKLHYTGLPLPSEQNLGQRRTRIADNMNTARGMVGNSDYTFLLEDDTDIKQDYLTALIENMHSDAGIISGVQAGRHGLYHIGAWNTDDIDNPTLFETVPYSNSGLRAVDATGFYCCLLSTKLFQSTTIPCEPLPVGPDVQFGLQLRKQGYSNFIVDDLKCGHIEETRVVMPSKECVQVRFKKTGEKWNLTK